MIYQIFSNYLKCQCKTFVELGAEKGSTPAEVVQSCDITISCVADSRALKDVGCYILKLIS